MTSPRAVLHVGLPKTGTSFLQGVLRSNTEVLGPARRPAARRRREGTEPAALPGRPLPHRALRDVGPVRGGRPPRLGAGSPPTYAVAAAPPSSAARRCAWPHDAQIQRILADLDGVEVDVVVTVRDPARQVPAEYQEGVKHGRRMSFPAFLETVLAEDERPRVAAPIDRDGASGTPRTRSPSSTAGPRTWAPSTATWSPARPRAPSPSLLWSRMAHVLGVDGVAVEMPPKEVNTSLGAVQIEVLRRLNRRVNRQGNERAYGDVVKRLYAGTILRGQAGERLRLPADARRPGPRPRVGLGGPADRARLRRLRRPRRPGARAGPTKTQRARKGAAKMLASSLDATADLLREVERLREENARLRGELRRDRGSGAATPSRPSPEGGRERRRTQGRTRSGRRADEGRRCRPGRGSAGHRGDPDGLRRPPRGRRPGRPEGQGRGVRRSRRSRPNSADEVVEAASAVLDTWSQPALGYDEWWSGLKPLLTPGGREAYSFTDPSAGARDRRSHRRPRGPEPLRRHRDGLVRDQRRAVRRRPLAQGRHRRRGWPTGSSSRARSRCSHDSPLPLLARGRASPWPRVAGLGRAGRGAARRRRARCSDDTGPDGQGEARGREDREARPVLRQARAVSQRPAGPGGEGREAPAAAAGRPRRRRRRPGAEGSGPGPGPGDRGRPGRRPRQGQARPSGSTSVSRRSRAGRRSRRASRCTACWGRPTRSATSRHWPEAVRMLASFSPAEIQARSRASCPQEAGPPRAATPPRPTSAPCRCRPARRSR